MKIKFSIKETLKFIHSGTFDYRSNSFRDHKFNRPIDNFVNYISQLPYLKLIGIPIAILIMLFEFGPIILIVLFEQFYEKIKSKLTKNKNV